MISAFWLALISGFAHASWNALAKSPGKERAATLTALIISLVAAIIRWATMSHATVELKHLPWIAMAGLGEATYVYALGMAYARGELALTYTVTRASALVFIWPLSLLAFSTVPSWLALAATALVTIGILLTKKNAEAGGVSGWHPGWTLLTGAAVAVYHTGYKGAVDGGATQVLAFIGAITIAIPLLLIAVGREVRAQIPPLLAEKRMLAAGVLCAASFLLMLEALATAESGRILGVRNSSVGFALIFAVLFFKERMSPRQWLGVAVLFGGVAVFGIEQALR
ncbi:MAG: EamA family transporter [Archangium sp.]|nr:EamA family transporter [Archangium sp.]